VKRLAVLAVLAVLLVAACAGGPPPPDWQLEAHGALEAYKAAYLKGDAKSAASDFARARHELAATGRAELVAKAELMRCALETASLEFGDCPGFAPVAADAGPAARAYAAYLAGRWQGLDVALLPPAQRAVVAGARAGSIEDPLSRLVAAGVLMRTERIAPPDIVAAVEAASSEGWRRPLVAWLGVEEARARSAGDVDAAAALRRRIELVLEGK
jgi:hypothetical protein